MGANSTVDRAIAGRTPESCLSGLSRRVLPPLLVLLPLLAGCAQSGPSSPPVTGASSLASAGAPTTGPTGAPGGADAGSDAGADGGTAGADAGGTGGDDVPTDQQEISPPAAVAAAAGAATPALLGSETGHSGTTFAFCPLLAAADVRAAYGVDVVAEPGDRNHGYESCLYTPTDAAADENGVPGVLLEVAPADVRAARTALAAAASGHTLLSGVGDQAAMADDALVFRKGDTFVTLVPPVVADLPTGGTSQLARGGTAEQVLVGLARTVAARMP